MIDTHAHLDACAEPAAVVLGRGRAEGVDRVITVGTGIDSCHEALRLAESEPGVYAALGVHPHDAGGDDAGRLGELRDLAAHERAVAIGETGLDHYRNYAPRTAQRNLFDAHIELATELALPLVIHSRAAARETADALAGFEGDVVLHCFSEPDLLEVAVERKYYVSFAGNVTYPNADALRAAAREIAADRLLAETDCPFLAPQPVRGRPNEPAYVVHTIDALAAVRDVSREELNEALDANADRVFGLR
ncbi:MAG TPA: TatD family hydrolase [Gaiellaceae bacterium]|nr:TatD family hydrolase [Gaiellaceae bacterium]